MRHSPKLVYEVRELQPTNDGWARCEKTGRANVACSCGLITGWASTADATRVYGEHCGSAPQTNTVRLNVGASQGGSEQVLDIVKRWLKR
ncbi:hypothetical protein [Streptomyces sp. NPDC018031]|uniref:hypothetical protein n=1 Tax=Streptomyces sp. NPDC018031 TaxID=3365033 RepID=UPI003798E6BB